MEKSEIYKAVNAVQAHLASVGVSKTQTNTFDRYKFRGIDDIYNALAPALAEHGLCVFPRVLNRECQERASKDGKALFYVTVDVEFDFVAVADGSKHTVKTYGEAMDRSDKATNKAMSAAYKYACFQTFCIPTEGDNDADRDTHEVQAAETVSAEQVAAIKAALNQADYPEHIFMTKCQGGSIESIHASAFDSVIKHIHSQGEKQRAATQRTA